MFLLIYQKKKKTFPIHKKHETTHNDPHASSAHVPWVPPGTVVLSPSLGTVPEEPCGVPLDGSVTGAMTLVYPYANK